VCARLRSDTTGVDTDCGVAAIYIIDGYKHSSLILPTRQDRDSEESSQIRFCADETYYAEEGQKSYISDQNRMIIRCVCTVRATLPMGCVQIHCACTSHRPHIAKRAIGHTDRLSYRLDRSDHVVGR
jgi:hypothetical protein